MLLLGRAFPIFFKFLSSFFLILGHSWELKTVTTMFKECITENLIRCTKARLSMDGALGTKVKKKKGTHNICGRFNFFLFLFLFRFTGLSGRLIQTVPTLT